MEKIKYHTIEGSVTARLQFLSGLPSHNSDSFEKLKEEILITPDCLKAALMSMSKNDGNFEILNDFLQEINTFLWNHKFESQFKFLEIFSSTEWTKLKKKALILKNKFDKKH